MRMRSHDDTGGSQRWTSLGRFVGQAKKRWRVATVLPRFFTLQLSSIHFFIRLPRMKILRLQLMLMARCHTT